MFVKEKIRMQRLKEREFSTWITAFYRYSRLNYVQIMSYL